MSTIEQIAQRAGVSKVTVSNVLNGRNKEMWPSTARRADMIREIARELNYRPNAAAKAVRTGQFGMVGLVLSESGGKGPLAPGTWFGIEHELNQHNLHLATGTVTEEELANENRLPKILREWSVDGLIMHYTNEVPTRLTRTLQRHQIPSVWMNVKLQADCTYPDDENAGRRATEHLIEMGHREIAYVCYSPSKHYSTTDRQRGYEKAMRQAGLKPRVIDEKGPVTQWHDFSCQWLQSPNRPTAVLAYEADRALPIYGAALELGLKVPHDLSIATFHDTPVDVIGRRMTTMNVPAWRMGTVAIEMLLKKIKKPDTPLAPQVLEHRLIEGMTCSPPRTKG